jgi:RNA polymerase sigma factor (TIGR02999 family)
MTVTTEALLRGAREGDREALDTLFTLAYDELRRIARRVRGGRNETLSTTALVHEAYLKLLPSAVPANDAAHFKLLIARAMREVLIDGARRRHASKRGGTDLAVTLDEELQAAPLKAVELLELHSALEELERVDSRRAAVVECRFFGGLDVEETAAALDLSTATVKRDWRVARAWLAQAMG